MNGFKSYGNRTVIEDLDPQFNAITGLNGSGKSNVLEAICFVLGLSKWTLARVTSLRELIYKNGQAGINQAEVTVFFDNRNKKGSPLGLEMFDEVKISRVIKLNSTFYKLNNKKETNTKIKGIFKSIGLNIDNYNTFFVQQGRITSIVNFKPRELMSFLEETAGIHYYNVVKRDCERTIVRKEDKLKNVTDTIEKDIRPELANLEKEKEISSEFHENKQNLIEAEMKLAFYKKKQGQGEQMRLEKELREIDIELKKNKQNKNMKTKLIEKVREELDDLGNEKEDETELEKKAKELGLEIKKKEREYQEEADTKEDITDKIKKKKKEMTKLKQEKNTLALELHNFTKDIKGLEEDLTKTNIDIQSLRLQVSGDDNQDSFLEDKLKELLTAEKKIKEKIAEFKRKLAKYEEEHKEQCDKKQSAIDKTNQLETFLKQTQHDIIQKKQKLSTLNKELKNNEEHSLEDILKEIRIKQEKQRQNLGKMYYHYEIHYNSEKKRMIDSGSIKGKVHSLLEIKDLDKFGTALDTIAGGKLFNIIVDNERTCQKILKHKLINGALNLIPVNKIKSRNIDIQMFTLCTNIAKKLNGNIWRPLEVIKYPGDLKPAFEYVFADSLIVSSEEIANEITFKNNYKIRCVTLDGDSFDPSGTLSGGYKNKSSSFTRISEKFKTLKKEIDSLYKRRDWIEKNNKKKQDLQYNLDNCSSSLKKLEEKEKKIKEKIETWDIDMIEERQEKFKREIAFTVREISMLTDKLERVENERSDIQKQSESNDVNKEQFIKEKLEEKEEFKKNIENKLKEFKIKLEQIKCKGENFDAEFSNIDEKIVEYKAKKDDLQTNLDKIQEALIKLREKHMGIEKEIEKEMAKLNKFREDREELRNKETRLEEEMKELDRKIRERQKDYEYIEKTYNELTAELSDRRKVRNDVMSQELDIPEEELISTIEEYTRKVSKYRKIHESLNKKVNKEAESRYNKINNLYTTLSTKTGEILNNKDLVSYQMNHLEDKKNQTVMECFVKVNNQFGRIFSKLLPGASAKMELKEIMNKKTNELQYGIEIIVYFNNKQKESLSELSGGQRSLLALSFLLALLSYRPAPFYIFDEIDAALDVSHTENFGILISEQFPMSQFIVISLKDEFFNNSNVLYKTSLKDGQSQIERFDRKKRRANPN